MDILYEELDMVLMLKYMTDAVRTNASRYFGKYAKSVNITNSDGL